MPGPSPLSFREWLSFLSPAKDTSLVWGKEPVFFLETRVTAEGTGTVLEAGGVGRATLTLQGCSLSLHAAARTQAARRIPSEQSLEDTFPGSLST